MGSYGLLFLEGQAPCAWGLRVPGTLGVIIRLPVTTGAQHNLSDQGPWGALQEKVLGGLGRGEPTS